MKMNRESLVEMLSHRGNRANNTTESNESVVTVKTAAGEQVAMTGAGMPDWSKVNVKNRPTQKMLETIKRNCEWKGVTMDESRCQTFDDAYAYIGELFALPFPERQTPATPAFKPCTEKQIAKIKELCQQNGTEEPDYSKLDGNYGGTASQFIQKQMEIAQQNKTATNAPISEPQRDEIVRYQLCPDVTAHQVDGKPLELDDIMKMSKQEAYEYISTHRSEYYDWIKGRLTIPQLNRIEQLQKMMGCPKLGYEALIQFDKSQASAYITQLESEYNQKSWQETTLEAEDDYLNDEVRHRFDTSEEKALKDMRAMAAKLYAAVGQQIEDVEEFTLDDYKDLISMVAEIAGEGTVTRIVEDNESLPQDIKDELIESLYTCKEDDDDIAF